MITIEIMDKITLVNLGKEYYIILIVQKNQKMKLLQYLKVSNKLLLPDQMSKVNQ